MSLPSPKSIRTGELEVQYFEWNPQAQQTFILVHGWPDAPRTWIPMASLLADQGFRVLAPTLRGFGGTKFISGETPRSGQLSVLSRDLVEFIERLRAQGAVLVGHDWGARAAAGAVGLQPDIASHLVMVSVGYGTNDPSQVLTFEQSKNFWYHWFMATDYGQSAVRRDPKAFAKSMWDMWSPQGWYAEDEFDETARAFENPDWLAVTLHSYQHRWGHADGFVEHAKDQERLSPAPQIRTPTLMVHGGADTCSLPATSEGKERYFEGLYRRVVLPGVGHFPQREDPKALHAALMDFVGR